MYVYREEGGLLSLLNGGRGMVKGGVGLSCLDSGKSLTLAVSWGIGAGNAHVER